MKQALIVGILMLAMAFAPAATAEVSGRESVETAGELPCGSVTSMTPVGAYVDCMAAYAVNSLPCKDPTPAGAYADCWANYSLNTAINQAQNACKRLGYDCDSVVFAS
jgi:hypothetical protein